MRAVTIKLYEAIIWNTSRPSQTDCGHIQEARKLMTLAQPSCDIEARMHEHSTIRPIEAMLVDPSLFTAPYDAALSKGLEANGVISRWAVRAIRAHETRELPEVATCLIFYKGVDGESRGAGAFWQLRKAISHVTSWLKLLRNIRQRRPDILHIQWLVLPIIDRIMILLAAKLLPIVITVHDTKAFNGAPTSRLQTLGFAGALKAADHLIVHTQSAKRTLLGLGFSDDLITIIPHGPLMLPLIADFNSKNGGVRERWRIVLFGRLQPYKGVDVLIEAIGQLSVDTRQRLQIIIAGEPQMPMEPIISRIAELNLGNDCIQLRLGYFDETEMTELLANADGFVFPYREIEASGVYYLVSSLGKWLVASDIGIFRESITPGTSGFLVPPGDAPALAAALAHSIGKTPSTAAPLSSWIDIGRTTRSVYEKLIDSRSAAS